MMLCHESFNTCKVVIVPSEIMQKIAQLLHLLHEILRKKDQQRKTCSHLDLQVPQSVWGCHFTSFVRNVY